MESACKRATAASERLGTSLPQVLTGPLGFPQTAPACGLSGNFPGHNRNVHPTEVSCAYMFIDVHAHNQGYFI